MALPTQHAAGRYCLHAGFFARPPFLGGRPWRGAVLPCPAARRRINGDADFSFTPATTDEEWLQLDAKANVYPSTRTFKAIGLGGQDFVDSMVDAVSRATNQEIDRQKQVSERPSAQGRYLAVSIRNVTVISGRQVLGVFREMKQSGGDRLKFII